MSINSQKIDKYWCKCYKNALFLMNICLTIDRPEDKGMYNGGIFHIGRWAERETGGGNSGTKEYAWPICLFDLVGRNKATRATTLTVGQWGTFMPAHEFPLLASVRSSFLKVFPIHRVPFPHGDWHGKCPKVMTASARRFSLFNSVIIVLSCHARHCGHIMGICFAPFKSS